MHFRIQFIKYHNSDDGMCDTDGSSVSGPIGLHGVTAFGLLPGRGPCTSITMFCGRRKVDAPSLDFDNIETVLVRSNCVISLPLVPEVARLGSIRLETFWVPNKVSSSIKVNNMPPSKAKDAGLFKKPSLDVSGDSECMWFSIYLSQGVVKTNTFLLNGHPIQSACASKLAELNKVENFYPLEHGATLSYVVNDYVYSCFFLYNTCSWRNALLESSRLSYSPYARPFCGSITLAEEALDAWKKQRVSALPIRAYLKGGALPDNRDAVERHRALLPTLSRSLIPADSTPGDLPTLDNQFLSSCVLRAMHDSTVQKEPVPARDFMLRPSLNMSINSITRIAIKRLCVSAISSDFDSILEYMICYGATLDMEYTLLFKPSKEYVAAGTAAAAASKSNNLPFAEDIPVIIAKSASPKILTFYVPLEVTRAFFRVTGLPLRLLVNGVPLFPNSECDDSATAPQRYPVLDGMTLTVAKFEDVAVYRFCALESVIPPVMLIDASGNGV